MRVLFVILGLFSLIALAYWGMDLRSKKRLQENPPDPGTQPTVPGGRENISPVMDPTIRTWSGRPFRPDGNPHPPTRGPSI